MVVEAVFLKRGDLLLQLGQPGVALLPEFRVVAVLPAGEQVGDVVLRHALAFVVEREAVVFHVVEPNPFGGRSFGEQEHGGGDAA